MKKIIILTLIFILAGIFPVSANVEYNTVIFALNSRAVICDDVIYENETEPYMENGDIIIPQNSAEKYFGISGNLSAETLENNGFKVFESYKFGFIAVGDLTGISFDTEEEIIKKFGIYVSENGDDKNSGYPMQPVKTFEAAQKLYRERDGIIYVHSGIYRRESSFLVTSSDDGMTIKAYGDGEVLVRGSIRLPKSAFSKTQGNIYEIDLSSYFETLTKYPEYAPQVGTTGYYELFSDNIPQTVARWPNYGYELTESVSGVSFVAPAEKLKNWQNEPYGMLNGYWVHNWAMENIYVGSVNLAKSTVTLSKTTTYGNIVSGQRYYAMNMLCELDSAGEYYIDIDSKKLYYYPTENFLKDNMELSVLSAPLFSVSGTENLTLSGLTFEYGRNNGVNISSGDGIVIDNCVIRNIGNKGIYSRSTNTTVKNCEIYNTGGIGIDMAGGNNYSLTAGGCVIENNNIYNFGRTFRTYQSAIIISGVGNIVHYNTIHDAPHAGVRYGGSNNLITHNEIYNVVLEASDSGAVYAGRNWTSWGNEVSYNYFHDIKKAEGLTSFTVSVVYVDDMLSGTVIENNVFENCTQAALIGGGRGNKFNGNIMINCNHGIDYDNRAVTGHWAHDRVIKGGTVYEGFVSFLANADVQKTLELRKKNHSGFEQAIADIEAYQKDNTYETGYPKDAEIKNNKSYGEYAENEDYDSISEYVLLYGTVSGNTYSKEIPDIEIPENGAETFLLNSNFEVYPPKISGNSVEFNWSRAGADSYEVFVTDESGIETARVTTKENGCSVSVPEKGAYGWKVIANHKNATKIKEGNFEIEYDAETDVTFFGGTDFEDVTLEKLATDYGWRFGVYEGDSITLETEENGNTYLKMVRNENNLKSGSATYALMDFAPKSSGTVTVTFDIMLENYRGGFSHLGTVLTPSGGNIMRLLTHSNWLYGVTTSGYNFKLSTQPSDSYLTVKRVINLDSGTYSMDIYREGVRIGGTSNKSASAGTASALTFNLSCQSPYTPTSTTGNGIYRIDNVYVDMGEAEVTEAFPKNHAENVSVNSEISVKMNTDISEVSSDTVKISENGADLSEDKYSVSKEGRKIIISVAGGLKKDSEYTVSVLKDLAISSVSHSVMKDDYSFNFKTEKSLQNLQKYEITDKALKIYFDETLKITNIKLYRYSVKSDFSFELSDNMLTIIPKIDFECGEQLAVAVNDFVYYIKNTNEPKIESVNSDDIETVKFIFNGKISSVSETAVFDNELKITDYSVYVLDNTIIFNFENSMKAGHTYTFSLNDVKFENGSILNFFEKIIPDKKFTATKTYICENEARIYVESNMESYCCIAVVKDYLGKAKGIELYNGTGNDWFSNVRTEKNDIFEYYFWDSIKAMNPLSEKKCK